MRRIKTKGIRDVRNVLIEHPEHGDPVPNYRESLILTDCGPVLKVMEVLFRGDQGRVLPTAASVDRGLYVNAEELRREIEMCVTEALSSDT